MKRNLLSVVILVLVLINTVLSVILMVSVVGTAKKTSALIDGISSALSLEIESQTSGDVNSSAIPMTSIAVWSVSESMTIPLAKSDSDAKDHYCIVGVSFSINKEHDDYATYGEDLSPQESLIKDQIREVISHYTIEEAKVNQEMIKQQILERVQALYNSDFIFNVSFGEYMCQ